MQIKSNKNVMFQYVGGRIEPGLESDVEGHEYPKG
jgi:hypothetical protein